MRICIWIAVLQKSKPQLYLTCCVGHSAYNPEKVLWYPSNKKMSVLIAPSLHPGTATALRDSTVIPGDGAERSDTPIDRKTEATLDATAAHLHKP